MRKVIFALTAAFALVAFLSACGMGLEPAKTDTTSVSLSFKVMSPLESGGSTDAGRAIIPDGGYLYVRMLGGPTANTPRFLGPYQVTSASSTVSITDIPAGQYDGMFLLYADRAVHDEQFDVEGKTITLGEIFSLPDTDFRAFVKGDDEYEVDVLLAGRASIGMVESPRVVEGKANSFRMTMFPITPYWIPVAFNMFGYPLLLQNLLYEYDDTVYDSFKGFVGIPGIQMIVSSMYPDYTGNVRLTFSNESTSESMTVNRLSVYDGEGEHTATPSGSFPITMPAGEKYSLDVPMPEPDLDEIFFYLDVSGGTPAITITLDEDVTVEPEYPIPETETITGSLDLADYAYNFDEITGVMFCTADPATWFNGTLSEREPPSQVVGGADLTAKETAGGLYDFTGTIYSDFAESALFLIVVGTKYEQPVMYASTQNYTVSLMSGLAPDMTPLMQYVVVIHDDWGDTNVNELVLLSTKIAQTQVVEENLPGTIVDWSALQEQVPPASMYAAMIQVTPALYFAGSDYHLFLLWGGGYIVNGVTIPWSNDAFFIIYSPEGV